MLKLHPNSNNPPIDFLPDGGEYDEIRMQVWGLLSSIYPKNNSMERRSETRYPFPFLVNLTPCDENDRPCGENIVVVGKHISHRGLGFYHPKPMACRRAIVSLENVGGEWYGFVIDLKWCRFTRQGWYESGGRFLSTTPSPLEKPA